MLTGEDDSTMMMKMPLRDLLSHEDLGFDDVGGHLGLGL